VALFMYYSPAMPVLAATPSGVICAVRVTPRAGRTAIAGVRDDILQIKLSAAPVDGAANAALVALVAAVFDLPKRDVAIVSGHTGRLKRVALTGLSVSDAVARLEAHLSA
jgi:uncharacterized protein (TIGR00251 family)